MGRSDSDASHTGIGAAATWVQWYRRYRDTLILKSMFKFHQAAPLLRS